MVKDSVAKKYSILILDDEQDVAELLAKRLRSENFIVETAANGLEGLEVLATFTPNLIMLDLNMPQMGGVEFYQKICDPSGNPEFPVLVVSGRGDMQMIFNDLSIEGFMLKPFQVADLLEEIDIIVHKDSRSFLNRASGEVVTRRVLIIENNGELRGQLEQLFTKAGYDVQSECCGVDGIERILKDPPDVALIRLNLEDVSGDLLACRLSQIARTRHVRNVVYIEHDFAHHLEVMRQIGEKTGIQAFHRFMDISELLKVVDENLNVK